VRGERAVDVGALLRMGVTLMRVERADDV
jgi:hypothetical protein